MKLETKLNKMSAGEIYAFAEPSRFATRNKMFGLRIPIEAKSFNEFMKKVFESEDNLH